MAKKKVTKKKSVASDAPKVNKSQAIRDMIASGVEKPKEVVAALALKGIAVSANAVSGIKGKMAGTDGAISSGGFTGKKRGPKPGSKKASKASSNGDVLAAVKAARSLIAAAGGVANAKALIDEIGIPF